MPVIVIGADTEFGLAIAAALTRRRGEVRSFVTDPDTAPALRKLGIKVAIGDVSDASHIEGAAGRAFSAVVVADAGRDDRERSFAASYDALISAWARGLEGAGVSRIIWVGPVDRPPAAIAAAAPETCAIDTRGRTVPEVADEAVRLDDLAVVDPD